MENLQDHITPIVLQEIADYKGLTADLIKRDTLLTNLGFDSLEVTDLAINIEVKLHIVISDIELGKVETVQNLIDLTKRTYEFQFE